MNFSAGRLLALIRKSDPAPAGLVVAFSGGRDSCVLLHALASVREQLPAALAAIHVNHQLHPDAVDWARHCRDFAAALAVDYRSIAVTVDPAAPEGLEAAARAARYAALEAQLRVGEYLLTAHHADDQLETALLQLLRGGGPAGVAAMPARARFGAGWLARPMLTFERSELTRYAETHDLAHVEDPSNADRRRDRNYLRHEIVPRLKQRWPAAATAVGRAARHAARARVLLDDLAALDLARIARPGVRYLPVDDVLNLGAARAENLVRYWLAQRGLPLPNTARLDTLLAQAAGARTDSAPRVTWPGAEVHCWHGRLYALAPPAEPVLPVHWYGESPLRLGAGLGALHAVDAAGGLRADSFERGVEVRARAGGERLRPAGRKHHRELKDLLREAGVVPWMRRRIPLLWVDDALAAVGDLWIADEFAAPPGEPGLQIEWRDRPVLF